MYKKLENCNYGMTMGTSYKEFLVDITYDQLVEAFGEPTFPEPSGDGKVQKEWVFKDRAGNVFTIYDWKTFDEHITTSKLKVWHVGGRKQAKDFTEWAETQINNMVEA